MQSNFSVGQCFPGKQYTVSKGKWNYGKSTFPHLIMKNGPIKSFQFIRHKRQFHEWLHPKAHNEVVNTEHIEKVGAATEISTHVVIQYTMKAA